MRKTVLLIAAAAVSLSVSAQSLPLLLIDTDARQAALCCPGEAGRQETDTFHADAGYGIWSSSAKSTLLSANAGYKLPSGLYVGLSAAMMKDSQYDISNVKGVVTGQYAPHETVLGLVADYSVTDRITAGIRTRYISSTLARYSYATVIGADAYCAYASGRMKAALEVCNLGNGADYGYGSYPQPSMVRASASIKPFRGFLLAADADRMFSGAFMAGIGAEYGIADIVFLRAGYHYGPETKAIPSYATLGAGGKFKGVSADAVCFLATETLRGTMMFRLGYSF